MKTKALLFCLIMVLTAICLSATKPIDYLGNLVTKYEQLQSWQASLEQINYYAQTKTTLKSYGNFYYKKGRLCIRYNKPQEQVLLVKDGMLTGYDKNAQTALKTRLESDLQSLDPLAVIRKYRLHAIHDIVFPEGKTYEDFLHGKATSMTHILRIKDDPLVQEIDIRVSTKTWLIDRFSYQDKQGNIVSLNFKNIKINQSIPNSIWNLNLPPGVQVIEN